MRRTLLALWLFFMGCGEPTEREKCDDLCARLNECGIEVGCPGWAVGCEQMTDKFACAEPLDAWWACEDRVGECSNECGSQELDWYACLAQSP